MKKVIALVTLSIASNFGLADTVVSSKVAELARVPNDVKIVIGPKVLEQTINVCKIKLSLEKGEVFFYSPSYGDAVFYKPNGKFSKKTAPYLFKPAVEHFSDMTWDYVKPVPSDEAWFGVKCGKGGIGDLGQPLYQANCNATKSDDTWVVSDATKFAYPNATTTQLKGANTDGFLIIAPDDNKRGFDSLTGCLLGNNQILMVQSNVKHTNAKSLLTVKSALRRIEFQ